MIQSQVVRGMIMFWHKREMIQSQQAQVTDEVIAGLGNDVITIDGAGNKTI